MTNWGKEVQPWVPLWTVKWLHGSTRFELTHEERAIFTDFLAMAAEQGGTGEVKKAPYVQLAHQLNSTDVEIERCVIKFIATGKIEAYSDKWVIKNWEEYQLQSYKARKSLKKKSYPDICGNKEGEDDPYLYSKEEKRREENRREDITSAQISEFIATYNGIIKILPKAERMTDKRRDKIRTRLRFQPDLEWWKEVFLMADGIHLPPNDKFPEGWSPSFDWLIENDSNPLKVHEGKYEQKQMKLSPGEKWQIAKEEQFRREEEYEKRRSGSVPKGDGQAEKKLTYGKQTDGDAGGSSH